MEYKAQDTSYKHQETNKFQISITKIQIFFENWLL